MVAISDTPFSVPHPPKINQSCHLRCISVCLKTSILALSSAHHPPVCHVKHPTLCLIWCQLHPSHSAWLREHSPEPYCYCCHPSVSQQWTLSHQKIECKVTTPELSERPVKTRTIHFLTVLNIHTNTVWCVNDELKTQTSVFSFRISCKHNATYVIQENKQVHTS